MPFERAGQLARMTPSARLDDGLGLVAENLRESQCGTLPVLDSIHLDDDAALPPEGYSPDGDPTRGPRVLGLIDEGDLSRAVLPLLETHENARREHVMSGAFAANLTADSAPIPPIDFNGAANGIGEAATINWETTPRDIAELKARDIMRNDVGVIPAQFSLHNALLTLDRYRVAALPVVDATGRYRGMISRADIVAALGRNVRPPSVGGMATPLGVWLTTGSLSAGAPALGLFLSGMILGGCFVASDAIMQFFLSALNADWGRAFASGRIGATAEGGDVFNLVVTGVQGLLFLLIMRLLPLSGVHAAEHQTVWAIEKGLALTPENVAKMPRAHPRCGTNLMALASLILIVFGHLPTFEPTAVMFSLIFIFFAWRSLGTALQNYLTTKPATPRQIEGGIKAGVQLLEKYQAQPHIPQNFGLRLLNSGMLLSGGGFMLVSFLYNFLSSMWANQLLGS